MVVWLRVLDLRRTVSLRQRQPFLSFFFGGFGERGTTMLSVGHFCCQSANTLWTMMFELFGRTTKLVLRRELVDLYRTFVEGKQIECKTILSLSS